MAPALFGAAGDGGPGLLASARGVLAVGALVVAAALLCANRTGPAALLVPLVCAAGLVAGLGVGEARLGAVAAGALEGEPGRHLSLRGFVEAVPKRSFGQVRFPLATRRGRVVVMASEPEEEMRAGQAVRVSGTLEPPPAWYREQAQRLGSRYVLEAGALEPASGRRGGLVGLLDRVRDRALDALERGMPPAEAELAKGFVLGHDEGIDSGTVDLFRDSGLAHLVAVSGQNVALLALLAVAVLAVLGVGRQARLICIAGLICLYVPLAGAGPSIQRAGVMGLAALAASAAGRPSSRLFALLAALVATLALNPLAAGDVGWQLSFAAVIGISLWSAGIREALLGPLGRGPLGRAVADGAAVTIAATLATAPLMAAAFERVSLSSLVANLAVMPAVAPAMWLGMCAAALGQLWPGLALPLNALNGVVLSYVIQVAAWFGGPDWAARDVASPGIAGLVFIYALLVAAVSGGIWWAGRRTVRGRDAGGAGDPRPHLRRAALAAALIAAVLVAWSSGGGAPRLDPPPPGAARVDVLDVGQGDAILVRDGSGGAVLFDAGPPGGGLADALEGAGVERLDALVLTHGDSDHIGGVPEIAGSVEVESLVHAAPFPELGAYAGLTGARVVRAVQGSILRLGGIRMEVLWPPGSAARGSAAAGPEGEPNAASIVALLRWRGFSMLLTGDAESEAAPYAAGDVDVLKVAHHGSEDAGLGALLAAARPEVALISVGAGNPYGHPTTSTLDLLRSAGAEVERTDESGTLSVEIDPTGYAVSTAR